MHGLCRTYSDLITALFAKRLEELPCHGVTDCASRLAGVSQNSGTLGSQCSVCCGLCVVDSHRPSFDTSPNEERAAVQGTGPQL